MSKRPKAICPKCFEFKELTIHHCFPSRWGKRVAKWTKLFLCRDCHNEIDNLLPTNRKMTRFEVLKATEKWLKGETIFLK